MPTAFKTILFSDLYDMKPDREEIQDAHLVGIIHGPEKNVFTGQVEVIKSRYKSNNIFVSLDTWFEMVKEGTEKWNKQNKQYIIPDSPTKMKMSFNHKRRAVINYYGSEDENSIDPALSIIPNSICGICHKTSDIFYFDPSCGENEGIGICCQCLKNIMSIYEENK
jgi:hypothetical protein